MRRGGRKASVIKDDIIANLLITLNEVKNRGEHNFCSLREEIMAKFDDLTTAVEELRTKNDEILNSFRQQRTEIDDLKKRVTDLESAGPTEPAEDERLDGVTKSIKDITSAQDEALKGGLSTENPPEETPAP